jgi:hypothetical protein
MGNGASTKKKKYEEGVEAHPEASATSVSPVTPAQPSNVSPVSSNVSPVSEQQTVSPGIISGNQGITSGHQQRRPPPAALNIGAVERQHD